MTGKIFAIGDIHGCLSRLDDLMLQIDIDGQQDTLVFIGDYIDRGPDSKGVVDYILEMKRTIHRVICLLGNHEQMFLDYLSDRYDKELYLGNGGVATLASYGFSIDARGCDLALPEDHRHFFTGLLPYYETESFLFAHAGLRPGIPPAEQDPEDLIWIRQDFIGSDYDFGKPVVFGHTPLYKPLIEPNKIGIDTGAVYGGKLTCIELPEKRILQA
ncbi:MAG: serine/threonine protein phosphatase [Deltaproteobacteria bacterium]|nr:serine/threonine protein phosphatase [Deltaproteobacteria bacterium]